MDVTPSEQPEHERQPQPQSRWNWVGPTLVVMGLFLLVFFALPKKPPGSTLQVKSPEPKVEYAGRTAEVWANTWSGHYSQTPEELVKMTDAIGPEATGLADTVAEAFRDQTKRTPEFAKVSVAEALSRLLVRLKNPTPRVLEVLKESVSTARPEFRLVAARALVALDPKSVSLCRSQLVADYAKGGNTLANAVLAAGPEEVTATVASLWQQEIPWEQAIKSQPIVIWVPLHQILGVLEQLRLQPVKEFQHAYATANESTKQRLGNSLVQSFSKSVNLTANQVTQLREVVAIFTKDTSPNTRVYGFQSLTQGLATKDDLAILTEGLKYPDSAGFAAEALGTLGETAVSACDPLLQLALGENPFVGLRATLSLTQIRKDAFGHKKAEVLERLTKYSPKSLQDDDCARWVKIVKSLPVPLPPELLAVACDWLAAQRLVPEFAAALWTIVGNHGAQAKNHLPKLLEAVPTGKGDWRPRVATAKALYAIDPNSDAVVKALVELLEEPDSRYAAIDALAKIGKIAVPRLIAALKDKDEWTRGGAALALATMNPVAPETVPALLQALRDSVQWPNAYGRQYESSHHSSPLVRACAWLGEASAEQLGEMLRDEKAPVRRAAACVLALSGPTATGAKRNLQRASNSDEDNDVRLYAYAALERMDRGEGSLKNNAEFSSLLSGLNNRHEEFGFARLIQLAKVLDGTPFAEFPEGSISTGYETTEGLKRLIPELRKAGLSKMADAAERKLKR